MTPARPLARFPLVDTSNLDETRAALAQAYALPAMELLGRTRTVRAIVNGCQLSHIGMIYGWYSAELRMHFPDRESVSQVFAMEGASEALINGTPVPIDSRSGIALSPGDALTVTSCTEGCARLMLLLDPGALANKLAAITGQSCHRPLKLKPTHDYSLAKAKALRDHFFFLVEAVSMSAAPLPKLAVDEFEQTLIVMFLHAHRHNYSHLLERLPPDCACAQVRRAEEFIEANWRETISLEDLAEITGVSAASLFRAFRKYRGYSPLEFAAQLRQGRGDAG